MAWPLVVTGMFLAVGLILINAPSPMLIAVGMYLPFPSTSAIFVGGVIAWALLACSGVALTVALERAFFWCRFRFTRDPVAVDAILADAAAGALDAASKRAASSRDPIAQILAAAFARSWRHLADEVELASREEIERARRGIGILDTIVAVAPLLGILGTVAGVIDVFDSIGGGGIRDASQMDGVMRGIGKALVTTAAGLAIAIPALLAHNALLSLVRRYALAVETAATRLAQCAAGEGVDAAD